MNKLKILNKLKIPFENEGIDLDTFKKFIEGNPTLDEIIIWFEKQTGRKMTKQNKEKAEELTKRINIHKAVKFIISELKKIGIFLTANNFKSLLSNIASKNIRSRNKGSRKSRGGGRTKRKLKKYKRTKKKHKKTLQKGGGFGATGGLAIVAGIVVFLLLYIGCPTCKGEMDRANPRIQKNNQLRQQNIDNARRLHREYTRELEFYEKILMLAKLFGTDGIFKHHSVNKLIIARSLNCIHKNYISEKALNLPFKREQERVYFCPALAATPSSLLSRHGKNHSGNQILIMKGEFIHFQFQKHFEAVRELAIHLSDTRLHEKIGTTTEEIDGIISRFLSPLFTTPDSTENLASDKKSELEKVNEYTKNLDSIDPTPLEREVVYIVSQLNRFFYILLNKYIRKCEDVITFDKLYGDWQKVAESPEEAEPPEPEP